MAQAGPERGHLTGKLGWAALAIVGIGITGVALASGSLSEWIDTANHIFGWNILLWFVAMGALLASMFGLN